MDDHGSINAQALSSNPNQMFDLSWNTSYPSSTATWMVKFCYYCISIQIDCKLLSFWYLLQQLCCGSPLIAAAQALLRYVLLRNIEIPHLNIQNPNNPNNPRIVAKLPRRIPKKVRKFLVGKRLQRSSIFFLLSYPLCFRSWPLAKFMPVQFTTAVEIPL